MDYPNLAVKLIFFSRATKTGEFPIAGQTMGFLSVLCELFFAFFAVKLLTPAVSETFANSGSND